MLTEAWAPETGSLLFVDQEPIGPLIAAGPGLEPVPRSGSAVADPKGSDRMPARDDAVEAAREAPVARRVRNLVRLISLPAPRWAEPAPLPVAPSPLVGRG